MSDHELWNEVGNLYFKSGEYELAKNAYARAIDLDHNFGKPYANLGVVHARQEKFRDAIALYSRALELLDETFDKAFTWYRLGNAYWDAGDYSLAMEAFHKADELVPGHEHNLVASPEMLLTSRRGVDEVLTMLDLPGDDVPAVEPTTFIASGQEFGRDAYLDDFSPWNYNEILLTDEEPTCPETDWVPFDDSEELTPSESVDTVEPLKLEAVAESEEREENSSTETQIDPVHEDETRLNLPERFVQEFALGNAFASQQVEAEPMTLEIEMSVLAVEEVQPVEIPFPVITTETLTIIEDEPQAASLENQVEYVEVVETEMAPVQVADVEVIAPTEVADRSTDLDESVEEVESEPAMEIAAELETIEGNGLAVEAEAAIEETEPAEVEVEPLSELVIDPQSEVVTEAPVLMAEDVTDPEPIQFLFATTDAPAMDSVAVWKEIGRIKRVLEINPGNARAWDAIGALYKSLGQYAQALDACQEAIALEPTTAIYSFHLAEVFAAQGKIEDAIAAFEKVLELNPEHGLAHATLGGYYRRQGRDDLAQVHIEKARGLLDEEQNEYNRACIEAICGNSDRALDLLEIALKNKQTDATWVRRDPDLDFVRSNSRFNAMLAEYEMSNTL
ncbi:MAG: tetratricopeptide repeat protein [Chloroflexota bacterium]